MKGFLNGDTWQNTHQLPTSFNCGRGLLPCLAQMRHKSLFETDFGAELTPEMRGCGQRFAPELTVEER
jgi:hypothetical protein